MERHFKPLNWLSALDRGEEQWRPHFLGDAAIDRIARMKTNAKVEDKRPEGAPGREPPKRSFTLALEVSAQTCQRAFNQARRDYPEALYDELSELAGKQLHISGQRVRRLVPNPFR